MVPYVMLCGSPRVSAKYCFFGASHDSGEGERVRGLSTLTKEVFFEGDLGLR